MSEELSSVSVIIPTLNAGRFIEELCDRLRGQTIPHEMIVIDSSSGDDTLNTARSCGAKTITIPREDFDHGGSRNLGVREANGDILVFMTQDALPQDKWLIERLIKPLEQPDMAGAYARQMPRPEAIPPERIARSFNYPETATVKTKELLGQLGIKTYFFSNVCSAIRRDVFDSLGGFMENLIMDEDLSFAARAIQNGYNIAYVSEAKVLHSHNYSWSDQFRRYFDTGVFFRDNTWLLQGFRVDSEGMKFVKRELRSLAEEKAYRWMVYVVGEILSKYIGFKLGTHYRHLPNSLRKHMSLHRGYWDRH